MVRCLNWRVLAGLGAVVLGVVVFEPRLALPALVLAVALACPVSMMLMMRSGQGAQCRTAAGANTAMTAEDRAEVTRLRAEIAGLKRERAADSVDGLA